MATIASCTTLWNTHWPSCKSLLSCNWENNVTPDTKISLITTTRTTVVVDYQEIPYSFMAGGGGGTTSAPTILQRSHHTVVVLVTVSLVTIAASILLITAWNRQRTHQKGDPIDDESTKEEEDDPDHKKNMNPFDHQSRSRRTDSSFPWEPKGSRTKDNNNDDDCDIGGIFGTEKLVQEIQPISTTSTTTTISSQNLPTTKTTTTTTPLRDDPLQQQVHFLSTMTFVNGGIRAPNCICCR